jgi:hypothetical protein
MNRDQVRWKALRVETVLSALPFDPSREVFTTPTGLDAEANSLRSRPERDCWA